MKNYIFILTGILLLGCSRQPQRSSVEAEDLLYEQYWQFQEYMLFEIGDKDAAIESLFKSAEAGYMESQRDLGYQYAYRPDLIGREKSDIDSAVIWWLKAAEQEDTSAQQELAMFHIRMKNWRQAKVWLKRAKKHGNVDEMLQQEIKGYEDRNVIPITKEEDTAVKQFYQFLSYAQSGCRVNFDMKNLIESAESGYVNSQVELGFCYANNPDLLGCEKPNIDSAVMWWIKAAEQENWVAQRELANYYADKKDWMKAKFWFKRAKKNGCKDKELQKKLNRNL